VLILILLYFGYIFGLFFPENTDIAYKFTLKIDSDSNANYTIISPVINNSNVIEKLKVKKGDGEFQIINIDGQIAIKIDGRNSIEIYGEYTRHGKPKHDCELTLHNNSNNFSKYRDYTSKVYCYILDNSTLNLYCNVDEWWGDYKKGEAEMAAGGKDWTINHHLLNGWQYVNVEATHTYT
jgi:hypothetical protein